MFSLIYRKLQKAEEQIELLSDGLDSVEKNVSELREQLNVNTKEAAEIELNINKEKKTIEAAQKLVEKLDDEFSRWGLQVIKYLDFKFGGSSYKKVPSGSNVRKCF